MGRLGTQVRMTDTHDRVNETAIPKLKLFPAGSVLFTKSGASTLLNQRAILARDMYVVSHIAAAIPSDTILSEWLYYWLKVIDFNQLAHATTLPSLPLSQAKEIPVPIAPKEVQANVIAEIEIQFSRLDEAVTSLKRAKANLKRYKAAVLKAAVEGKLTEEWRKQHPDVEPASELLKRILAERGQKSQESEINELYPIPKKWEWARLKDVFDVVTDGDHQAPPKTDTGIPFLVIGNLNQGYLDFKNTRLVPKEYYDSLAEYRKPQKGDLLYTVVGSYGIPVRVVSDIPFCVQRHIAILKPNKLVSRDYLHYVLASSLVYEQSTNVATGTAQKTVPLGGLRNIRIPLPPYDEQIQIVDALESYYFSIMNLYQTIVEDQLRCDRFKQATLLQAFVGKLVN